MYILLVVVAVGKNSAFRSPGTQPDPGSTVIFNIGATLLITAEANSAFYPSGESKRVPASAGS